MRSPVTRVLGVAAVVLLAGVAAARAEEPYPVEFTTSFPFSVGMTTLPAGTYTIRSDDDNMDIYSIGNRQTTAFFQVAGVQGTKEAPKTEVVFDRYGNTYVLKDVWVEGMTEGIEATTGEPERHHLKHGPKTGEERVPATHPSATSHSK